MEEMPSSSSGGFTRNFDLQVESVYPLGMGERWGVASRKQTTSAQAQMNEAETAFVEVSKQSVKPQAWSDVR